MTWYVVRKTHQELGAAFEDEEVAEANREKWDSMFPSDYEVVEKEEPERSEVLAGEKTRELTRMLDNWGL